MCKPLCSSRSRTSHRSWNRLVLDQQQYKFISLSPLSVADLSCDIPAKVFASIRQNDITGHRRGSSCGDGFLAARGGGAQCDRRATGAFEGYLGWVCSDCRLHTFLGLCSQLPCSTIRACTSDAFTPEEFFENADGYYSITCMCLHLVGPMLADGLPQMAYLMVYIVNT